MSSAFTPAEIDYLNDPTKRLARIATANPEALPHVTPIGMWRHDPRTDSIEVTGRRFANTKKFRNVLTNPQAAITIDDIATTDPWRPRAIIIQGTAEAIADPDQPGEGHIRIHPDHVVSWGLDGPKS